MPLLDSQRLSLGSRQSSSSSKSKQLSQDELVEMLAEVRKHFPNIEPKFDDFYLLRFLRARKYDVPKAVKMLQAHFKWRKEADVDKLFYDQFEAGKNTNDLFPEEREITEIYPTGYWGTDDDGRPIYFERLGKADFKALLKLTTKKRYIQFWIHTYEKLVWLRLPTTKPPNAALDWRPQTLTFIDLKNFGWSHLSDVSRNVFREIVSLAANNYPEIMFRSFVLNAPRTFSLIWKGLGPFIDNETRNKIRFISFTGKRTEIEEYLNVEKLPDFLGGRVQGYGEGAICDFGPWNKLHAKPPEPPSSFLQTQMSNDTFVTCIEDDSQITSLPGRRGRGGDSVSTLPVTIRENRAENAREPTCYSCCPWWVMCWRPPNLLQRMLPSP